jgi:TDG/mug DNA glycosylase family protein
MKILPDCLPIESRLVIIGCNPSLVAARTGFYYSGRGNQFWSLLHESGLVPERLRPLDTVSVTQFGIGLTDLVKRPTKSSGDVLIREFATGRDVLRLKLSGISCPKVIVFNGKIVYERFMQKKCNYGLQDHLLFGARVYVAPSTSRRCARISYLEKLQHFRRVFELIEQTKGGNAS